MDDISRDSAPIVEEDDYHPSLSILINLSSKLINSPTNSYNGSYN